MNSSFNSSVDMIVLVDHMMGKLVKLVESWGKKRGEQLFVKHKERYIARVARLQKKYVASAAGKVRQFSHTKKDEDAVLALGQFISYKSAELQGFSEPSVPFVEGETFHRQSLRSSTPITEALLLQAFSELGKMMESGTDPVEVSKTNEIVMSSSPENRSSSGGIVLPGGYDRKIELNDME